MFHDFLQGGSSIPRVRAPCEHRHSHPGLNAVYSQAFPLSLRETYLSRSDRKSFAVKILDYYCAVLCLRRVLLLSGELLYVECSFRVVLLKCVWRCVEPSERAAFLDVWKPCSVTSCPFLFCVAEALPSVIWFSLCLSAMLLYANSCLKYNSFSVCLHWHSELCMLSWLYDFLSDRFLLKFWDGDP